MSPAMVAAAAITGHVVDVRALLAEHPPTGERQPPLTPAHP
jgi:hypothetical protein